MGYPVQQNKDMHCSNLNNSRVECLSLNCIQGKGPKCPAFAAQDPSSQNHRKAPEVERSLLVYRIITTEKLHESSEEAVNHCDNLFVPDMPFAPLNSIREMFQATEMLLTWTTAVYTSALCRLIRLEDSQPVQDK
jgi:hypothetical protein